MSRSPAAFLAGARGRLLPASIPLRYFGAAVVFHVMAWLALLAGAQQVPRFAGGLHWPLAALHLATLGVLVMTAIGASLQLLPVATRQPVVSLRAPAALWWVYTPGVATLALGMGLALPLLLAAGAATVIAALLAYAALLARNLTRARGMPGVLLHGWAAIVSLVVMLGAAAALTSLWLGRPIVAYPGARALHLIFAAFGFMGMLALGLSYLLVPMFALAPAPDTRGQILSGGAAVLALLLAAGAAAGIAAHVLYAAALCAAAVSVALYLALMRRALATGMRRELGRSLRLVRLSWGALILALAAAAALVAGMTAPGLEQMFVLLLVGGWLLTFAFGILQRILPFLAAMHAGPRARPPTPSALTAERPLATHFACHLSALALLAIAVATGSGLVAALAGLAGLAGALAFAWFYVELLRRLRRAASAAPPPAPGT